MRALQTAATVAAAMLIATPAAAQDDAATIAAELRDMRAKVEALEARLAQIEADRAVPVTSAPVSIAKAPAPPKPETGIAWKGAPVISNEAGWSFKPRGRLQYDVAHVESPDGIVDPGLGWSNELRRARLGVEGAIPGGLGYKFEIDFADNATEITDAILIWDFAKNVGLTIGQHNNFQSLEELTSSRFTSFIERAAFTDAFGFERRVGASLGFARGPVRIDAGVFTDNIEDLSNAGDGAGLGDENNALSFDARAVYAPRLGTTQLHLGASAHHRDNNDLVRNGVVTRYRQRPLVHSTSTRLILTPNLEVEKETSVGLEAAVIRGPFHAAAETHWLSADLLSPNDTTHLFGGYAELGWYLTGETRGYKDGTFDRTKVRNPVSEGGLGAFQINLRYDYLDLIDRPVIGGRQNGLQASLIWIPQDYVRFMLNYGRLSYDDAFVAALDGNRNYTIDVAAARAQVDF